MRLKGSWVCFIGSALVGLSLVAGPGCTATITVNPAGGGNYTTIAAAVADLATWSNATDDTILVTDDAVNPASTSVIIPASTLTIRNNPGDTPVIEIYATPEDYLRFNSGGSLTVDGLTFMGDSEGGPGTRCIRSDPQQPTNLTVRNCIFTKNNGSDVPLTDWSAGIQPFGIGTLRQSIRVINGENAVIHILVENCVFAYQDDHGAITLDNEQSTGTTLTVRNCLFLHGKEGLFRVNKFFRPGITTTVQNCLFWQQAPFGNDSAIYLGNEGIGDSDVIVEDTAVILQANISAMRTNGGDFAGGLTINRCSFVATLDDYSQDFINLTGISSTPSVAIADSVFVAGATAQSALRVTDFFESPIAPTLTLANLAVVGFPPYRADQHADLKAAFDGLYGGTGPITADPEFASTDVAAALAGVVNTWDSATNTLVDVGSEEYCGKASGGANLSGGAETAAGACGTPVEDWNLY